MSGQNPQALPGPGPQERAGPQCGERGWRQHPEGEPLSGKGWPGRGPGHSRGKEGESQQVPRLKKHLCRGQACGSWPPSPGCCRLRVSPLCVGWREGRKEVGSGISHVSVSHPVGCQKDLRNKASASLYRRMTEAQGPETPHHGHRNGEPLVPAGTSGHRAGPPLDLCHPAGSGWLSACHWKGRGWTADLEAQGMFLSGSTSRTFAGREKGANDDPVQGLEPAWGVF